MHPCTTKLSAPQTFDKFIIFTMILQYWNARPQRGGHPHSFHGSPWENGYCESFNGKLCDELFNGEIFHNLKEAKVVIDQWRYHYNTVRSHSSLGYRPASVTWVAPSETISGSTDASGFELSREMIFEILRDAFK